MLSRTVKIDFSILVRCDIQLAPEVNRRLLIEAYTPKWFLALFAISFKISRLALPVKNSKLNCDCTQIIEYDSGMYLMYVDESGDVGLRNSPSDYFVLSGLVVHELKWDSTLQQLIAFRKRMRAEYNLKMDEEIHATDFIHKPGKLSRIDKHDRLAIIRNFASEISQLEDCNLINVVVDKTNKNPDTDVFELAWNALINRFERTIRGRNFPRPKNADDKGLIFPDRTDDKKLIQLLRKMRYFNPTPNRREFGQGYRNLTLSKRTKTTSLKVG